MGVTIPTEGVTRGTSAECNDTPCNFEY